MKRISRRALIAGGFALVAGGVAFGFRRKLLTKLRGWTRDKAFAATPALVPHDPARDRRTVFVAKGGTPAANIDTVLDKVGLETVVGTDDLVLVKVSAQWWNQGMTNVAAVKRTIERILARPGFTGEVVVFENTHFRLADGSPLARAFTRPSERNVDVPGWTSLGDLVGHFKGSPVSFVGLVDAAPSSLAGDGWHDPAHAHGTYGGDGRGPIEPGDVRDGMRWDFEREFAKKRGWFEHAKTPLTWPVFTSPHSGLQIDLADGVFRVDPTTHTRTKVAKKLTWISMVTVNEHGATGMTACCKSAMGIVDMSAGRLGIHPAIDGYNSIHYFGVPDAQWRMAGPLAHFAKHVRAPDLYLAVAEWVGLTPAASVPWDDDTQDLRLDEAGAHRANTIVAGVDPVAVDWYCARNVLAPIAASIEGRGRAQFDLRDPASTFSKFLRYYREVWGQGTMDDALITVLS